MKEEDLDFEITLELLRLFLKPFIAIFFMLAVAGFLVINFYSSVPGWTTIFCVLLASLSIGLANSFFTHGRIREFIQTTPLETGIRSSIFLFHYLVMPLSFAVWSIHFFLFGMWFGFILK